MALQLDLLSVNIFFLKNAQVCEARTVMLEVGLKVLHLNFK